MIIKNVGSKIVNIGSVILMPDEEMKDVPKAYKEYPSIQVLVAEGFLKIIDESKSAAKAAKAETKTAVKAEETEAETNTETDAKAMAKR